MRGRVFAAAGLAFALAAGVRAQSFGSAHFKSKSMMEGGPQGDVSTESEVWVKDKATRMKMAVMGMNINVIRTADFTYQWQDGQATGMKLPASIRQRGGPSSDYLSKLEDVRSKGKKLRTETVDGHPCEVYEYDTAREMGTSKETYWLAQDLKGFPVKVVMETGSMKITHTNSSIEIPAVVSEAMVTPPKDVQFQDMSGMMKSAPPKQ